MKVIITKKIKISRHRCYVRIIVLIMDASIGNHVLHRMVKQYSSNLSNPSSSYITYLIYEINLCGGDNLITICCKV